MRVAISGASGFVGSHLSAFLEEHRTEVIPLSRHLFGTNDKEPLAEVLSQCDVVINLAGATLNRRWTEAYRREIYESRIHTTRTLVEAINSLRVKPELLISTSAVGYYPSSGCYGESDNGRGTGFLSDLCRDWEDEVTKVSSEVRWVVARFAVVLSSDGGVFPKMAGPAQRGLAVQFASGIQNFAWIDMQDLLRAIEFIITHRGISGPVNMVSPRRLTNAQFAKALAKHFHAWITLPVPAFALQMLWGDASQLLLSGQCAYPEKLQAHGFTFSSNGINDFLSKI